MVIIAGHAVWLMKTVGELRQATGETEDTALRGFHLMLAGLTVCCPSAE